jgi:hypothetical protein
LTRRQARWRQPAAGGAQHQRRRAGGGRLTLSTIGALCIAAIPAGEDPRRLFRQMPAWGLSMTIAGALFCQLLIGAFAQ